MRHLVLLVLPLAIGCGDNTSGSDPLDPLVDDPQTLTDCQTELPTAGQKRAKRVSCEQELASGRLAAGRIGDLVLENARVRVIIRGPGDGYYLYGSSGGAIIDAAQHGRDDLLQEIVTLVELNTMEVTDLVVFEAGNDGDAEVAVRGRAIPTPLFAAALGTPSANVIVEQRYRLAPDTTDVAIETRVFADPDAPAASELVGVIDALFLGGHVKRRFPGQPDNAVRGPLLASSGTTTSYAIVADRQTAASLTLRELVFFELLELPTQSVGADPLRRHLVIGDGSLSSVVGPAWAIYGEPTFSIQGQSVADVQVVARDAQGNIASAARTDAVGNYELALPAGTYQLRTEADNRHPGPESTVELRGPAELDLAVGASGAIELDVSADGQPAVARVVARSSGGALAAMAYTAFDGTLTLGIPPGDYNVDVSKGMEFDSFSAAITVADDDSTSLAVLLDRVIDSSGWISVDPHMHSEMSIDSEVPLEERLLSIAAEGVEVAVSSDHDFVVDYAPVAIELGLGDRLKTISGQESTSLIIGHINAWPSPLDFDKPGHGAIDWYNSGPTTVFERARDGDPNRIVQVNHPWDPLGFFTAIGFERSTLSATKSGADLGVPGADLNDFSFDALEIGNKKTEEGFEQSFGDWLALISAGFDIAATGASDSHGDDAFIGEARTFVFVGDGADDPSTVTEAAINEAIRSKRAVVAQGIFVTAGLAVVGGGTSLPGEVVDLASAQNATLRIRVQAPPWMPTRSLVIYERAQEIMRVPLDVLETASVRFDGELAFPLDGRDTLFVVVVEPGGDGRPVMAEPKPSFTNPLYVDRNGNGAFDP